MKKLVRSGTEKSLEGKNPQVKFARCVATRQLLFAKLLEEASEWSLATNREQHLMELGDIQEVLWALGEMDGIDRTEIALQAANKRAALGEFDSCMTIELEQPKASSIASVSYSGGDGPWYSG